MVANLIYDGSFDGFLSCVFCVYEEKLTDVTIQTDTNVQSDVFCEITRINTNQTNANRVWKGLSKRLTKNGLRTIYYAFLSELSQIEQHLLEYIRYVFESDKNIENDFSHQAVMTLSKIVKSVGREKHRMEAFVRFRLTKDGFYFAIIEPDFNVLPLIEKHFKSRYADQKWVIFDVKRQYGLRYDLSTTDFIKLDLDINFDYFKTSSEFFANEELEYQNLWQNYFKSTNIASRKNMKLHVQHVPKRYWKYLSEKN